MTDLPEKKPSTCPRCGTNFVCGAEAGLQTCWCMEKPTGLFEPEADARCYCPTCLSMRISACSSQAA